MIRIKKNNTPDDYVYKMTGEFEAEGGFLKFNKVTTAGSQEDDDANTARCVYYITTSLAQNSRVQVFVKLFLSLPVYSCYFSAGAITWPPRANTSAHVQIPVPTCKNLTPSRAFLTQWTRLPTMETSICFSENTANFNTKLCMDTSNIVSVIRMSFWDPYLIFLTNPPP